MASKNSNSRRRLQGPEYQPRVLIPVAGYKIYYLYLGERGHKGYLSLLNNLSLSPFHKHNIFQKWRILSFPDRGPLSYAFIGQDYSSPARVQSQKILLLSLLLKRVPQHRYTSSFSVLGKWCFGFSGSLHRCKMFREVKASCQLLRDARSLRI